MLSVCISQDFYKSLCMYELTVRYLRSCGKRKQTKTIRINNKLSWFRSLLNRSFISFVYNRFYKYTLTLQEKKNTIQWILDWYRTAPSLHTIWIAYNKLVCTFRVYRPLVNLYKLRKETAACDVTCLALRLFTFTSW